MRLTKHILFLFVLFSINLSYGQPLTMEAYDFYKDKNFEEAKIAIDSAIKTTERFDSQTWQLRGVIYRNLSSIEEIYYREIALESFVRAKAIDTIGIYKAKINDNIKTTILRYYNDAVILLSERKEFDKSEEAYDTYKRNYLSLLDPNHDFTEIDINYYSALGSEYLLKTDYVEPLKKFDLRSKALLYFEKVLLIDSTNYQANFNIGIVYYNTGADFIMIVNPEITLEKLMLQQESAKKAFFNALPYLKKADLIKPNKVEVYEALMGCYYGLHKNDLYLKYQTLVDEHYIESYLKRFEIDPEDQANIKHLIRIYSKTIPNEAEEMRFRKILAALKK